MAKAFKVSSLLVLFTLLVLAIVFLLFWSAQIGLSPLAKDLLVFGLLAIILFLFILAMFRPNSLLLHSTHYYEIQRLKYGDSSSSIEYDLGELPPSEKPPLITDDTGEGK